MRIRAHLGLEQIAINPDAFACLVSRDDSNHDCPMGIQSRCDICYGDANFAWRSIGFPRSSAGQETRDRQNQHVIGVILG